MDNFDDLLDAAAPQGTEDDQIVEHDDDSSSIAAPEDTSESASPTPRNGSSE